jgi:hypothetical protein
VDPTDKWGSREFLVKWKRWSYIHCSWDTRATLSQLGGYKRVLNYMKRVDEREVIPFPSFPIPRLGHGCGGVCKGPVRARVQVHEEGGWARFDPYSPPFPDPGTLGRGVVGAVRFLVSCVIGVCAEVHEEGGYEVEEYPNSFPLSHSEGVAMGLGEGLALLCSASCSCVIWRVLYSLPSQLVPCCCRLCKCGCPGRRKNWKM